LPFDFFASKLFRDAVGYLRVRRLFEAVLVFCGNGLALEVVAQPAPAGVVPLHHGMCLITPVRISAPAIRAKITAQVSREILERFGGASVAGANLFSFAGTVILALRFRSNES
jgi:hypothetical protein